MLRRWTVRQMLGWIQLVEQMIRKSGEVHLCEHCRVLAESERVASHCTEVCE